MKEKVKKMTDKELAELMFPDVTHDVEYYEKLYPERNLPEGAIVSRFAPSPTGFVHMGSLRSAFIEQKLPRDTNGVFYLRIEDTDGARTVENGIQGIIDDLKNFDIQIDEGVISETEEIGAYGPYIQSKRREIYRTYAKSLVERGLAYPCFCTQEELDETRKMQELNKNRGTEESIENKIKEEFNLKSFVSIDETSVTVTIDSTKHDKELANKIMRSVQEEFETSMSISVKFQK